jgi:flagellar protein FliO/FliZ
VARRPLSGHRGTGTLSVLTRQPLSRGAAVTIVQVADKALILGVTEQQVSLLGETELTHFAKHPHVVERRDAVAVTPDDVLAPGRLDGSVLSPRTWRSTMEFLRDRTTRH